MSDYLRWLSERVNVLVVDASPAQVFEAHHRAWSKFLAHVPVDPAIDRLNGKVVGVLTGLDLVETDKLVIADDDVRYGEASLTRTIGFLDRFDLVRPQNYFSALPWHATWDTARTLLNRSFGADYPGTLAVRTKVLKSTGGYDGDVLFENLEMIRTVKALGGTEIAPLDLYVRRLPPGTDHFVGQRVRQAYDEFTLPARLIAFLSVVPLLTLAVRKNAWARVGAAAVGLVGVAEIGRTRAGGRKFFPARASWFAPLWVLERGLCMWLALGRRIFWGGVPYGGRKIRRAANSLRKLKRRYGGVTAGRSRP
ncbi:MAG: hypothetical protein QOK47_1591 [Actinomycetota bacterium]|nr:hypothetical protein [Actinomycetota bacterium]